MYSLKGITRVVTLILVACMVSACIQVWDKTITPAHYVSDGANSRYDIKAKVNLGPGVIGFKLKTSVVPVGGIPIPIQMAESGVYPSFEYSGKWPLSPRSLLIPWSTGCGFLVRHVAQARFLGIIPLQDSSTKQIQGDQSLQGLVFYGRPHYLVQNWAFTRLTSGTVVDSAMIMTAYGIDLANSYPEPITIQSVTLLCDGNDCGSMTNSPIVIKVMPALPVTLNCGVATSVTFSCTETAIVTAASGKAKFMTDKGNVNVPFTCTADPGG